MSIVGLNAFAHEAAIYKDAVTADGSTYEIMRPKGVSFAGSHRVFGKLSGRHALAERARTLGIVLRGNQPAVAFAAFKARAGRIGLLDDPELIAILPVPAQEFVYVPAT